MNLHERLSRLLSGELPPDQAAALRARIVAEPEVAAAWADLVAVVEGLEDLPATSTPPALAERVYTTPAAPIARASRWRWWAGAAGLVAAAAAILAIVLPGGGPVDLLLVDGVQWVDGAAVVHAGDVVVAVDGRARITVEPGPDPARSGGQDQEGPVTRAAVLAAAAGAVVTVAVYEGTAVLTAAADTPEIAIAAGQTRTVGQSTGVPLTIRPPGAARPAPGGRDTVEDLERQLADLDKALEEARFSKSLAEAQLVAHQGEPSDWPNDVPDGFGEAEFETALRDVVGGVEGAEIAEVDCAEYPCIAAIRVTTDEGGETWADPVGQALHTWFESSLGPEISVSLNRSRFKIDDADQRYVIFGAHAAGDNSGVSARTDYRISQLVDELGERVADEVGP